MTTVGGDNMVQTKDLERAYILRFKSLANKEEKISFEEFSNEVFTGFADGIGEDTIKNLINENISSNKLKGYLLEQLKFLQDWRDKDDRRRRKKSC